MPKRQLVLMKAAQPGDDENLPSMGGLAQVLDALSRHNTAPDGSTPKSSVLLLYGPGMLAEIAAADGPASEIRQIMVTMTDDDFAFPILSRLCREQRWTMMDPETGRRFGP